MVTFGRWLRAQDARLDAVGDLARAVRRDADLRWMQLSPAKLRAHLVMLGGSEAAIAAVAVAAREFTEAIGQDQPR